MRRFVSIALKHWPTDRRRQRTGEPELLALTLPGSGGIRLAACDAAAMAAGLRSGMTLADARARVPHLRAAPADPAGDALALRRLARWATRYTPFAAPDGADGLVLDITGCAHLFGGEEALVADMRDRLVRAGLTGVRVALADTPAAAWAWARFGHPARPIVPAGGSREALAPLPVAALRLPGSLVDALSAVGLRRIGDLLRLPRAALAARYGGEPGRRLDQALGHLAEPITPVAPCPVREVRRAFPEPIGSTEVVTDALRRLLGDLCGLLADQSRGGRRFVLALYRVDATVQRMEIGTGAPTRDPADLFRLFAPRLDTIDAGFGIETMMLSATVTDALGAAAPRLDDPAAGRGAADLVRLLDRLRNRPGLARPRRPVLRASHLPERAAPLAPLADEAPHDPRHHGISAGEEAPTAPRPVLLFDPPEPVEAMALLPDSPPARVLWRGRWRRVARAEGPERIAPEWWRDEGARTRDYYRIEDEEGRRLWVYRDGLFGDERPPRWFAHGLFG